VALPDCYGDIMNTPNNYEADDYAGLAGENASFYYGYEETYCKKCNKFLEYPEVCDNHDTECCFVATFDGGNIKIPFSKLGGDDEWACRENLLIGIGLIFAKYRLTLCT